MQILYNHKLLNIKFNLLKVHNLIFYLLGCILVLDNMTTIIIVINKALIISIFLIFNRFVYTIVKIFSIERQPFF
ncbi:hypothetical protein BPO_0311 [Bergeyella porcorum]|uniref:Uncharacterized protein n=1 Tax=Bergeyella porcorum TaxID=1735111 RepID=A0AAU0EY40_9FLAO